MLFKNDTPKSAWAMMGIATSVLFAVSCRGGEQVTVEPVEPETQATATMPGADIPTQVAEDEIPEDTLSIVDGPVPTLPTSTEVEKPVVDDDTAEDQVSTDRPPTSTEVVIPTTVQPCPEGQQRYNPDEKCRTNDHELDISITINVPQDVLHRVLTFLASELNATKDEFSLIGFETVTWVDGSLGCPQPGHVYTKAIIPGYKFVFSYGTASYAVHTNQRGTIFVRPIGCYAQTVPEPTRTAPQTTE